MEKTMINSAMEFAENIFKNEYSGHDFFHTLRVYKTAVMLAKRENADETIVGLAALLHDVDDIKLSPETHEHKDRAVAFLREHDISEKTIERICSIISEISFNGTGSVIPETLEGKCVQDADRLDAMGAVGIARAFAYGGSHGRTIYDPNIKPNMNMDSEAYRASESTSINHFYEKLFKLRDLMNTDTAKEIAAGREEFMRRYIAEFMDEWEGLK